MFTGIVEERGVVVRAGTRLEIRCRTVGQDSSAGSSVAVNGVCLTVTERRPDGEEAVLVFDVSPETVAQTALDRLRQGDPVNLERPVTLLSRLGGHLVQGHVDGVGEATAVRPDATGGARLAVRLPAELLGFVVEKGSIAFDGVSLTVAAVRGDQVEVALIPHTLAATTLGGTAVGDPVNVEVDVVAKYVARHIERLVGALRPDGDATEDPGDRGGRTAWTNA